MLQILAINWWVVGLRGLFAILFGVAAILWPALTLGVLITLFGVYAILDGIFTIVVGVWGRKDRSNSWLIVFEGLIRIGAGLVAIIWPGLTSITLVILIAIWALVTGVLEIIIAIRLRKEIEGEWMLVLSGIISVLMGVVLFSRPQAGALAGILLIGFYAILFGILLIIFAFQMQKRKRTLDQLLEQNS